MRGEGGIFPRALTHRIRFAARLILEGDRLRRYLTRSVIVMIMRYTTEPSGGCHFEQTCFGLFYEVLIIFRGALDLYAVCVSLLTLPPSWKLETRARLRFGSASLETGIAARHGTIACVLRGLFSPTTSPALLLINGLSYVSPNVLEIFKLSHIKWSLISWIHTCRCSLPLVKLKPATCL